jgi:hypothetical protein
MIEVEVEASYDELNSSIVNIACLVFTELKEPWIEEFKVQFVDSDEIFCEVKDDTAEFYDYESGEVICNITTDQAVTEIAKLWANRFSWHWIGFPCNDPKLEFKCVLKSINKRRPVNTSQTRREMKIRCCGTCQSWSEEGGDWGMCSSIAMLDSPEGELAYIKANAADDYCLYADLKTRREFCCTKYDEA